MDISMNIQIRKSMPPRKNAKEKWYIIDKDAYKTLNKRYLHKNGKWITFTQHINDDLSYYDSREEAQYFLNKWINELSPEEFAKYIARRMLA